MKALVLSLLVMLAISCQPEPKAIQYGQEACQYCRMTIVDERYASQLVSQKNKAYSFDAIECMIHFKEEHQDQQWALELVSDYNNPGQLIPAGKATVLRSKELPSPMGAYLTAVGNKDEAQELQKQHEGTVYSYEEIARNIDNLPVL